MLKSFSALCAVLVFSIALPATAMTTYRTPLSGVAFTGGLITTGGRLVFPDLTLADLEGKWFWGRLAGAHVKARDGFSNKPQAYPSGSTGENIQRFDFDIMCNDGGYVKAVHIQLYNGEGGVWAKITKAWYITDADAAHFTRTYYTVNQSTGTLTWNTVQNGTISTGYDKDGYVCVELGVAEPLSSTPQLVFPGATVSMFANNLERKLSARVCGSAISEYPHKAYTITNAAVTAEENGVPVQVRFEAQFQEQKLVSSEDVKLKCSVVELSNGEGGVYARVSKCLYKSGAEEGFRFVNADGTVAEGASDAGVLPSGDAVNGYSAFDLAATDLAVYMAEPSHFYNKDRYIEYADPQLVFPHLTLAAITNAQFYGTMCGPYISQGANNTPNGYSMNYPLRYPADVEESIQKLYVTLSTRDGKHDKFVLLELTERSDGVYATIPRCCYREHKNYAYYQQNPYSIGSSGNIVLDSGYAAQGVANSDNGKNMAYGVKQLGVCKVATSTDAYVFQGLSAATALRGEVVGKAAGAAAEKGSSYFFCNRVIEAADNGKTTFRAEGHLLTSEWDKVAVLKIADGDDGLEVKGLLACYRKPLWGTYGLKAVNDAGTAKDNNFPFDQAYAVYFQASGYGVYDFGFALPDDAATGPAYAVWNGGDPALAASWECRSADGTLLEGALPDRYTYVTTAGNTTMTADADMTPYASFRPASGSTIDTAGRKFTVATLEAWPALTVTDTVGGGELILDIPEKMHSRNSQIAFSGKLKLVKKGAGCFEPAKNYQTYTGGTQIAEGKLMFGISGNGTARYWGMGGNGKTSADAQIVQIDEGAFLDLNANYNMGYMTLILNGGEVYGESTNFNSPKILQADSKLTIIGDTYLGEGFELNGHTLSLDITANKTLEIRNQAWKGPGRIKALKGGWLKVAYPMSDTSVDLENDGNGCALDLRQVVKVRDYTAGYNFNANVISGSGALQVYGTFTPKTAYFTAATMMDGSTIDISAKTLPWSAQSGFSSGNQLKIADGANIAIRLPEGIVIPEDTEEVIVVTNLCNNVNIDVSRITCDLSGVTMENGGSSANIRLFSSGTGLVLKKIPGLAITVR